jgi:hypothetical protein
MRAAMEAYNCSMPDFSGWAGSSQGVNPKMSTNLCIIQRMKANLRNS